MVKEFECKKSADVYAAQQLLARVFLIAQTYTYKYNEDLSKGHYPTWR